MFRATMCPPSGETTVSMRHLVFVTLVCRVEFHSTLHTWRLSIQSDKYQVSHRYSCFSWWWTHSRPKHVEKRNRHTKKNCASSWLYLQDETGLTGNITKSETGGSRRLRLRTVLQRINNMMQRGRMAGPDDSSNQQNFLFGQCSF